MVHVRVGCGQGDHVRAELCEQAPHGPGVPDVKGEEVRGLAGMEGRRDLGSPAAPGPDQGVADQAGPADHEYLLRHAPL